MSDDETIEITEEDEAEPTEEELLEAVQAFKAANQAKLQELQSMQRGLEPYGVMMSRVEVLIDYLFNAIPAARYQYELLFEQNMSANLDAALKQARIERLAVDVTNVPSSIRLK